MSDFKDIYLTINHGEESVTIYPKTCQIKRSLCNENLQHEESSVELTINYEPDVFRLLALSDELDAVLNASDGTPLFTGIINSQLSWEDMGDPCPVDSLSVTIHDYTNKLEQKTISEIGYINSKLEDIIQRICDDCSLSFDYTSTGATVPAFVLDQGASYKTNLDNLLFQYGFCYFFDAEGVLKIWDFKEVPLESEAEALDDSEIFMSPKISRLDKKYKCITVKYNTLTKKTDELVYYAGSGYQSDNTAAPAIVQKNTYYPFESDPNIESDQGKVQQSFSSGYAESYKKYNGETAYRRSSTSQLVYTEKHRLVEDWEKGNIQIDRTDFGYRQAAVRLLNTADEDAQVYSISIRADAWYRDTEHSISCGTGTNEYVCESEFIFDSESAASLVRALNSYFCGVKYKADIKTDRYIIPGTFVSLDTGLSGFRTLALAVSSSLDADLDIYSTTLITLDEPVVKPLTRQSRIYTTLKGEKGDRGEPGTDGANAAQYYIHFVYCDDISKGTNYSTSQSKKYIGVYTDTTQADAATFNEAKAKAGIVWSKAEGEDGTDGTTPTVSASTSDGKTTITINGTVAATINDGKNGTSLVNRGNWTASTKYNVLDCVYVAANKTSYMCKTAHTSGSSFAATNWSVLAAQGDPGTTPTVTATKSDGKTTITINGTVAATINDGSNGKDASQIKDNLLLNSNFGLKNLSSWNTWGNSTNSYNSDPTYGHCAKLALGTGRWKGIQQLYTAAKPNCTYTVSAMFWSASPDKSVCIGVHHLNNSTIKKQAWESKIIPQGNWYQLKLTFTTTSDTNSMLLMFGNDSESQTNFTMYVTNLKLEENSTATAWILNSSEFKGATGNFTKRISLYYVSTSATAPAAPTKQVTATGAATTTTWTKDKYTTFAVGLYYYTCEQIETYNSAGKLQSCSWSAVTRDTEYENAGTAKLRAAGKYIGQKSAAFTAYTASSNWDWFLATKAFTVNSVSVAAGNVYVWNGSTWTKDTDTSHLAAAMNDMIALVDSYTTNATSVGAFATVFAQTLAAKSAFIKKLFAEKILMQTNGIIRGGSRYNDAGTVVDASKNGFWISADGTIKGNLQSDNGNILLGDSAGLKLNNIKDSSGIYNIAAGHEALKAATSANHNVAIGTQALLSDTSGSRNVAVGEQCLKVNTTGNDNIAAGYGLVSNTTGNDNIGIGRQVSPNNKTGNKNISIGTDMTDLSDADRNIFIGTSITHNAPSNVVDKNDNVVIGNYVMIGGASSRYVDGNIIIGKGIRLPNNIEASQNIIIGAWKGNDADTATDVNFVFPAEGDVPSGGRRNFWGINIGDVYLSQAKFFLSGQKSITGSDGIRAALIKQALFEKGSGSWGRVFGVKEYQFTDSFGYIRYTNGLLIQWGKTTSSSGKASVSFRAYTSRESYAIFVAEGVQDCETRTTQDDTNGYDYGAGIDQKYESSCIFTCQSDRNIFYLAIGY